MGPAQDMAVLFLVEGEGQAEAAMAAAWVVIATDEPVVLAMVEGGWGVNMADELGVVEAMKAAGWGATAKGGLVVVVVANSVLAIIPTSDSKGLGQTRGHGLWIRPEHCERCDVRFRGW